MTKRKKSPELLTGPIRPDVVRKIWLVNNWPKLSYADRKAFLARLDKDLNLRPEDEQE
ncbi:hypothetical protein [Phaeovulum veldkampii]|uniref:hypothetical protein n=1 Tax=Phaeovulum veldkampii TaxID=33049 RepID=UPI0010E1CECC|nr:hypothetical protein [Phaeovulum veldkampii]TDQ57130.1 hypothetical protein EV658_11492 [Phaeovulum veldkampii DSM 11550]